MIKSSNVQLKAREKDSHRLKSKLVHLEGKSLAAMQRGEGTSVVSMQSLSNKKLFPSASNDRVTYGAAIGGSITSASKLPSKVKLPDVRQNFKGARLRQAQKDIYNIDSARQQ